MKNLDIFQELIMSEPQQHLYLDLFLTSFSGYHHLHFNPRDEWPSESDSDNSDYEENLDDFYDEELGGLSEEEAVLYTMRFIEALEEMRRSCLAVRRATRRTVGKCKFYI